MAEIVRVTIAEKISALLDQRDADGKKILTQAALGKRLGVSQEATRRARDPDGVTPAIVEGMRKEMLFRVVEASVMVDPERAAQEEEAIELLVRRGVRLRDAARAIKAIAFFKRDEPIGSQRWADLAHALVVADGHMPPAPSRAETRSSSTDAARPLNLGQETRQLGKGSRIGRGKRAGE